jgi:hypothetical protein
VLNPAIKMSWTAGQAPSSELEEGLSPPDLQAFGDSKSLEFEEAKKWMLEAVS